MKGKNEWPNISSFNDFVNNYTINWVANGTISGLKLYTYKNSWGHRFGDSSKRKLTKFCWWNVSSLLIFNKDFIFTKQPYYSLFLFIPKWIWYTRKSYEIELNKLWNEEFEFQLHNSSGASPWARHLVYLKLLYN